MGRTKNTDCTRRSRNSLLLIDTFFNNISIIIISPVPLKQNMYLTIYSIGVVDCEVVVGCWLMVFGLRKLFLLGDKMCFCGHGEDKWRPVQV